MSQGREKAIIALDNLSITIDELGLEPTTTVPSDFNLRQALHLDDIRTELLKPSFDDALKIVEAKRDNHQTLIANGYVNDRLKWELKIMKEIISELEGHRNENKSR